MPTNGLSQLIHMRCVRPDHLSSRGEDRVFVHAGGWAYCPAGRGAAGDHHLINTGGLALRHLESARSSAKDPQK